MTAARRLQGLFTLRKTTKSGSIEIISDWNACYSDNVEQYDIYDLPFTFLIRSFNFNQVSPAAVEVDATNNTRDYEVTFRVKVLPL